MHQVGIIKSIYRYPVKSMEGEKLASAELGWHGIEGDRRFAFMRTGNMSGMPWLTASKLPELIRYKAYHVDGGNSSSQIVRVRTPDGTDTEVGHESLRQKLTAAFGSEITLMRMGNGIFDDAPVSMISTTTLVMLETESGCGNLDARTISSESSYRANLNMPVHEDAWIGKTVFFGNHANAPSVRVTVNDIRCVMVNLDPETAVAERGSSRPSPVHGKIVPVCMLP